MAANDAEFSEAGTQRRHEAEVNRHTDLPALPHSAREYFERGDRDVHLAGDRILDRNDGEVGFVRDNVRQRTLERLGWERESIGGPVMPDGELTERARRTLERYAGKLGINRVID